MAFIIVDGRVHFGHEAGGDELTETNRKGRPVTIHSDEIELFVDRVDEFLKLFQLDGQGRARREAARRRKSEWKVNVAIPNSSRSNGSWQITPKTVSLSIVEPRGIWTCVSLQCTSTSGGSKCAL